MSDIDTKAPGDKTLHMSPKTLSLKRPVEQNTVRQSFSHGRSKAVVVETVKRRAPGSGPAPAREAGPPPANGPKPGAVSPAPAASRPVAGDAPASARAVGGVGGTPPPAGPPRAWSGGVWPPLSEAGGDPRLNALQ